MSSTDSTDKTGKIDSTDKTVTELMPKTRGFLFRFDDWGKSYWKVAHAVTFLYSDEPSEEEKGRMIRFFQLFPFLLPCSICGLHFVNTLSHKKPLNDDVLASRDTLSRWLVEVHNLVNERVGKSQVDYESVRRFYMEDSSLDPRDGPSGDCALTYKIWCGILAFLLAAVIVGGVVYVRKNRKRYF